MLKVNVKISVEVEGKKITDIDLSYQLEDDAIQEDWNEVLRDNISGSVRKFKKDNAEQK